MRTGGTRIKIYEDRNRNNKPRAKVLGRSKNKGNTKILPEVIDFLNDLQNLVLPFIPQADLPVFTEHKRDHVLFRAHPNFMGRGPWKDWVLIDWGAEGKLPCHICCFVDLTGLGKFQPSHAPPTHLRCNATLTDRRLTRLFRGVSSISFA